MRLGSKVVAAVGVGATVVSAAVVALAIPALGKGIASATITGPGLVRPIDDPSPNMSKLPALTAIWEVTPGHPEPVTLLGQAPTRQLGPAYTLTWRILTGPDKTTPIRQDVYPHAEGGPLVHTAPGQAIFGGATAGGWYRAHTGLRDMLTSLGVPPPASAAPAAKSALATPPAQTSPPDDSAWPGVIIGATAAMALASVGGAVAFRRSRARRRERVAPVPL